MIVLGLVLAAVPPAIDATPTPIPGLYGDSGSRCILSVDTNRFFSLLCPQLSPKRGWLLETGPLIVPYTLSPDSSPIGDGSDVVHLSRAEDLRAQQRREEHDPYPLIHYGYWPDPMLGPLVRVRWRKHLYLVEHGGRDLFCAAIKTKREVKGTEGSPRIFKSPPTRDQSGTIGWKQFCHASWVAR